MSLASRVLAGLVAGSLLGLALAGRDSSFAAATLTLAGLVGGLFIDLIRMCAMPLVASLVVASLGASGAGSLGRAGLRTVALAVATLVAVTLASIAVSMVVLSSVTPDAGAFATTPAAPAAPDAGAESLLSEDEPEVKGWSVAEEGGDFTTSLDYHGRVSSGQAASWRKTAAKKAAPREELGLRLRLAVIRPAARAGRVIGVIVVLEGTRHALQARLTLGRRQLFAAGDGARLVAGRMADCDGERGAEEQRARE